MLNDLNSIVGFAFSTCTSLLGLYLSGGILGIVLATWLLRKIATIFDKLR